MISLLRYILQIRVLSVFLGVVVSAYAGGSGADWRFYANSEFGTYCYDMENISRLSNQFVRVSQKLILNNKGTVNLVGEFGKEYEKAREAIILREIDCINKRSRILELTLCSGEGTVMKRETYTLYDWDSIVPDSVDDVLYRSICK
jgi:hypothetical protein